MLDSIDAAAKLFEAAFLPILMVELLVLGFGRRLAWPRVKEMLGNAGTFFFFVAGGIAGVTLWTDIFQRVAAAVPWSIPTRGWSVVPAIVVADFVYYWEHRLGHEVRVLWDLYHSVHHSSTAFDQSTSLRLGLFDGLLTLGFSLPMVLLGFSPELTLVSMSFVVGYQTWLHTELIDKLPRWFEAVFNTPSHHRAHHGAERPYLDVNYGGILILWDRLFGTFQAEESKPRYGLTQPLASSNPITIQFSELRALLRDLRRDRSWRVRLERLVRAPGWQPESAMAGPTNATAEAR